MARILAISSQVVRGSVGLSIIVPALQALGHEVLALPTVLLSNHPGHAHTAGTRINTATLTQMLDALAANGWLDRLDGVLTGYLPTLEHVAFAREAVNQTRAANPACNYLCDPVMGDDPKGLYIEEAVASAIRDTLVPLAGIITPNRFEASYLSGRNVGSAADVTAPFGRTIIATSIPGARNGHTLNVLVTLARSATTTVPLREDAPHGTGDLFAALYLGRYLAGRDHVDALTFATAGVDATLAASTGSDQLSLNALMTHPPEWVNWPLDNSRTIS